MVTDAAGRNPDLFGMGTALLAAVIAKGRLHLCHVGDLRAYLLDRKGGFTLLTTDHTLAMRSVQQGVITMQEARMHYSRHHLTQAVGGYYTDIHPETFSVEMPEGAVHTLCTDGAWATIPELHLKRIMAQGRNAREITIAIVRWAYHADGEDNITVMTIMAPEG